MTNDPLDDQIIEESFDDLESDVVDVEVDDAEFDDSSDVMDIDDMVEKVYGNAPKAGKPFSMAEEIENDEEDRRGI